MKISKTPSLIKNLDWKKYWPRVNESFTQSNVDNKRSEFGQMKQKKITNTKARIILKVKGCSQSQSLIFVYRIRIER